MSWVLPGATLVCTRCPYQGTNSALCEHSSALTLHLDVPASLRSFAPSFSASCQGPRHTTSVPHCSVPSPIPPLFPRPTHTALLRAWRCLLPAFTLVSGLAYSSTRKTDAACYSETLVDFQQTTRRYTK
jgi:hypothetical protein